MMALAMGPLAGGVAVPPALGEPTVIVTGLTEANASRTGGMVEIGTKADEMNVRGNTQMNPICWAASTFMTARPTIAEIHEIAKPKSRSRSAPR